MLLIGPPGTGETLLARAVAGEARVPFFSISGSEFVEMFVGVGAARVRDLFEQARRAAPCIIFIDELNALGRSRISGASGGYDEKELAELDARWLRSEHRRDPARRHHRPEVPDPALLRPGRFDRQVVVDRPDRPERTGRLEILKVYVAKVQLAVNVDLDQVAGLTPSRPRRFLRSDSLDSNEGIPGDESGAIAQNATMRTQAKLPPEARPYVTQPLGPERTQRPTP